MSSVMKTRIIIQAGGGLLLCGLFFWLGTLWASRRVATYSVNGTPVAFHRDWPISGLPFVEYSEVLSELRSGHSQEALDHLEMFLDSSIYSAERRRPLIHGRWLAEFDKSLSRAARYRAQYPRPLSQGTGFYWTADKQTEVDSFLRDFVKQ